MKVHSIFQSINGEVCHQHQGSLTVFVRLFGCNCRCSWCDTKYSYTGKFREMRIRDIVKEVLQYGTSNVTITGGEPLIQRGTISLISTLKNKGLYVTIETNGSKFIPPSPRIRVSWVVDYKLPSSGMEHLMHFKNFRNLYDNDFIKFVITDRKDFDRSLEVLLEIREKLPYQRAAKVAFSPALGMNRKKLVTWMIESNYLKSIGAICNLQLHKLIGVS